MSNNPPPNGSSNTNDNNNNRNPAQRAAAGRRQIRGPHSALTDFLAAHNISAQQIQADYEARRRAAATPLEGAEGSNENEDDDDDDDELVVPEYTKPRKKETKAQALKRKKDEEKAIAKIKASKKFQRDRKQYGDDSLSDEDDAARDIFERTMAPLPGQMENCEICDKRFTVTAYSRKGPSGGLLCPACSKDLDKEEGAAKKKRKTTVNRQRRQVQSNLLDGIYPGAKDLVTLCVETLAKNVDEASDLGDLPPTMVDRVAAILSKKRLLKPNTLNLFLRPGYDTVTIYDGAYLTSDDYIRMFQYVPTIKHLRLRNAIQFKDKVMDHLLATNIELQSLSLHGANLIDDERWNKFITEKGQYLQSLKVYFTDRYFGDEQIELLTTFSQSLRRLKVCHNQRLTDVGVKHIAKFQNLEKLSLETMNHIKSKSYVEALESIGTNLRTLSLSIVPYVEDSVLDAIHDNCKNLTKLRITDNQVVSDETFANLFAAWSNPPLTYVDFNKCRYIDASHPRENPDGVGFGSLGFAALMAHSGSHLRTLRIDACRHISLETFETVFGPEKTYPELKDVDLSFCQSVNDYIVGRIFRSCPNLKTLTVCGNFGVKDVVVPKGKILIGVPNAIGMRIEGTDDGEGRVI